MLQSVEYQALPYLKWFWSTQDFSKVEQRGQLIKTNKAKLLLIYLYALSAVELLAGIFLIILNYTNHLTGGLPFGIALILATPVVAGHALVLPIWLGQWLVVKPFYSLQVKSASRTLAAHPAIKIAVAGSYGKTTMKELLRTVLSEGKKVAATPANRNVASSHAQFAKSLKGDEEVLIIEFGEGAPGDVVKFSANTHPTHGVITGLAPAHLDKYGTLEQAGKDIFALAKYLKSKNVYVNGESMSLKKFLKPSYHLYDAKGALGWKVQNIKVDLHGMKFDLVKGSERLKLTSGLIGRHHLGPLSLTVALALEFGLTKKQVTDGVAKTKAFEHRLQPYLLNGAWVIDDSYNGNIEGIKAGTDLLKDLPARRKIYVTPGLVDQGKEKEAVHNKMGEMIAGAKPDLVVLMKNSATAYIRSGLQKAHYSGELLVEEEPLEFYNNMSELLATGDVIMLQNDWPDQYS